VCVCVCCCRNGSGLLRRDSEWCQKEKTDTSNNNMRLWCEKKVDPVWQSKETSPKKRAYPIGRQQRTSYQ
jgi:hypothetical protein